jgi:hypothetical protein
VRCRIWVHESEKGGARGAEPALRCGSHFKCQSGSLFASSRGSRYPLVPQGESLPFIRLEGYRPLSES